VLTVSERLGVERVGEAVTSGVPFARGVMRSGEGVALLRGGVAVPLQARPTSLWPDGSMRWLLLDFAADAPAGASAEYELAWGDGVESPAPDTAVELTTDDGIHRVDTGALRFSVATDRFAPLADMSIREGEGWREPGLSPLDVEVVLGDGRSFLASAASDLTVVVEEAGPLRASLLLAGHHAAEDGSTLFEFRLRVHAYPGSPAVRLQYTFVNDASELFTSVRRVSLLAPSGASYDKALFGIEGGEVVERAPTGDGVVLRQSGPTAFADDKRWILTVNADAREGARAAGWAVATGEALSMSTCVQRFWQNHPAAIAATGDGLSVDLICSEDGPLPLRQGAAKTHELLLAFAPAEEAARVEQRARAFISPLRAEARPEFLCRSGVFGMGPLRPAPDPLFPRYEDFVRACRMALQAQREEAGEYGALDFGDWSVRERLDERLWGNVEYDMPHAAAMEWARTGDAWFYDLMIDSARHYMDVDVRHSCREEGVDHTGAPCIHTTDHWTGAGNVGHAWVEGLWYYHFLTGDGRAREVALGIADWQVRVAHGLDFTGRPERYMGWELIGLVSTFEATGDAKYLDAAGVVMEKTAAWQHPAGYWPVTSGAEGPDPDRPETLIIKPFMIGMVLEGLIRYHQATGDARAADSIARSVRWMIENTWDDTACGFRYSTYAPQGTQPRPEDVREVPGVLYAYGLTGDADLLALARRHLAAFFALDPSVVDSTWLGKSFAIRARALPNALAMLAEMEGGMAGGTERDEAPR